MYEWKWYLKDLKQDKDVSVFSTFSCGGGSTMGYKRAGFKVLGNVEIDASINEIYKANHHPLYNYNMDLRKFNSLPREDLPNELFHLDILDGSPPCSTFSSAGLRENAWGKEKKFREGQAEQTLDDLFFIFLDTVEKLRPRVVIAENVVGLVSGRAKGYVNEILKRFKGLGYAVQIFRLNAAKMNVPQARERVFFIANRCGFPKLTLNFNEPSVLFGEVRTDEPGAKLTELEAKRLENMQRGDLQMSKILKRTEGRQNCFNQQIVWDDRVCRTITASGLFFRAFDKRKFSDGDYINTSTFPQDYDFKGFRPQYICGMSVPPNMMANIAGEVWRQWLVCT